MEFKSQLKSFTTRIRWIRAWQGAGLGGAIGAIFGLLLSTLDWFRVFYTNPYQLIGVVAGGIIVGALVNGLRAIPEGSVAKSVDRRAGLEDRLVTATERSTEASIFDEQVRSDAHSSLTSVTPKSIYPVRVDRSHYTALVLAVAASAVFLLGNTPIFLNDSAKTERKENQAEAARVERLLKETLEDPKEQKNLDDEQRRLAAEMRKLQQDLEKGRIPKEEALKKANEIAQKADELANQKLDKSEQLVDRAESALEKWQKSELEKAGAKPSPSEFSKMSEAERNDAISQTERDNKEAEKSVSKAQSELDKLQKQLSKPGLSEAEKKEIEKAIKEAEKQKAAAEKGLAAGKKRLNDLKLSKQAQDILKKMMSDPKWKEIQELARKLKQNAQSAKKNAGQQQLSEADRKKMLEELEKMLAELKDDKAMQEYLDALKESLKNAKTAGQCNKIGIGLGMGGLSLPIPGGPSDDIYAGDSGSINKLDKPVPSQGKTTAQFSPTMRDDLQPGAETYTEIKAPTAVSNRSSVPYIKVLPGYKQKAESAIRRSEIPKQHEKRVKKYFESLSH